MSSTALELLMWFCAARDSPPDDAWVSRALSHSAEGMCHPQLQGRCCGMGKPLVTLSGQIQARGNPCHQYSQQETT